MVSLAPRWFGPPRLARALSIAGAEIAALSHAGSMLAQTRFATHHLLPEDSAYHLDALLSVIASVQPERLLPADELAVRWLHELHGRASTPEALRDLIDASLGEPAWFGRTTDKLQMGTLMQSLGFAAPITKDLVDRATAHDFILQHGFPVVIKACSGYAGIAVYPCHSLRDLRHALRACPTQQGRLIQRFETGSTWSASFVAHRGELLAQLSAEKERQFPEITGPGSIFRFEFNPELLAMCTTLVRVIGFSGFGSIDCLLTATGRMLFLEFNPRATPLSHLGAQLGVDLAAAYVTRRRQDARSVRRARIALFPQELLRDSSGAELSRCVHDIPTDEPDLLACLNAVIAHNAASRTA